MDAARKTTASFTRYHIERTRRTPKGRIVQGGTGVKGTEAQARGVFGAYIAVAHERGYTSIVLRDMQPNPPVVIAEWHPGMEEQVAA